MTHAYQALFSTPPTKSAVWTRRPTPTYPARQDARRPWGSVLLPWPTGRFAPPGLAAKHGVTNSPTVDEDYRRGQSFLINPVARSQRGCVQMVVEPVQPGARLLSGRRQG
jgi:hypothetical protein